MGLFDRVKTLFKSKIEDEDENTLEKRIETSLKEAEADRREVRNQIKQLDDWARDAILDVYADFFPNANLTYYREQHKEKALENYEQIKTEHGPKMEQSLVEKCDRVVNGYKNQISLLESQEKLFDKLYNEYSSSLEKLKRLNATNAKMSAHQQRLAERDDDTSVLAKGMSGEYKLEDIKNEVAHKEEYFKQLEQLNQQYGDDKEYTNALAFKTEVDKMINDLG